MSDYEQDLFNDIRKSQTPCLHFHSGEEDVSMRLYSIDEAAKLLTLSHWTIRAMIRDGRLQSAKVGRRRVIRESELKRLVVTDQLRAAEAAALNEIMTFLDEQTPEDTHNSHWAARAYQEVGKKCITPDRQTALEGVIAQAKLEEHKLTCERCAFLDRYSENQTKALQPCRRRAELEALRDTVECFGCGERIKPGVAVCETCGARQKQEKSEGGDV